MLCMKKKKKCRVSFLPIYSILRYTTQEKKKKIIYIHVIW